MPNRILKETICTSEEIEHLEPEAEVLFYRLIVNCDDYGLADARLAIIKGKCYPLKSIDINRIQVLLAKLSNVGLIQLYEVDGKPYLHVVNWHKHQQIRAKKSKYPMPEEGSDINCNQLQSNVPVIQSNPIQSSIVKHDKIEFDGSSFQNINGQLKVWKDAYPAIDVEAELKKAAAWLMANPKNKKSQYARFLNNWFSRAQDKAPRLQGQSSIMRGVK